ncbi:hypothetical protein AAHA92_16383 [Salvia divinorum]|uniref:Uncharacterized protein n=1 Tax=Salvia divinorum TaxID=28513 RepID=A0ABD1GVC5_SALDI
MLLLIAWGAARHLYLTAEPLSSPRRRAAASLLQRPDVPVRVLPSTGISGTPLRQQRTTIVSRSRRLELPLRHTAAREDAPPAPKSQSSSVASGRAVGLLAVVARSLYRCRLPSPLLGRPIEIVVGDGVQPFLDARIGIEVAAISPNPALPKVVPRALSASRGPRPKITSLIERRMSSSFWWVTR